MDNDDTMCESSLQKVYGEYDLVRFSSLDDTPYEYAFLPFYLQEKEER